MTDDQRELHDRLTRAAGPTRGADVDRDWGTGRRRRRAKRSVAGAAAAVALLVGAVVATQGATGSDAGERAQRVASGPDTAEAPAATAQSSAPTGSSGVDDAPTPTTVTSTTLLSTTAPEGSRATTTPSEPGVTTLPPRPAVTSTSTSTTLQPAEPGPGGPTPGTAPGAGGAALWDLDPAAAAPTPASTTVAVGVMRASCSGGVTGTVLAPEVRVTAAEVIVTYRVEAMAPGAYTCPSNPQVPATLRLDQPIGDRVLVDGFCRSTQGQQYGDCRLGDGVRWPTT